MSRLEARGLGYSIGGRQILAGVSLTVGPGERLAVVGPSGSGKTTLLALLAGLATPDSGQVLVDGRPVRPGQVPPGVATVLQGHGLVALLTATENVEITLFAAGMPAGQAAAAAQDALAAVGLAEHTGQLADELSGGQQQRVAVARALASQPTVLLADEPTAEQDSKSRELVLDRMFGISADGGTLVLATHDPEVAQRCDRVLDLSQQRTVPVSDVGLAPR
jgi:putative ABC transport system ATP-binding protein